MSTTLPLQLILAPSHLGLRPLRPGHVPGTWRGPEALLAAGLASAVRPVATAAVPKPHYDLAPQPGTRWRNGNSIRAFNLDLATLVAKAHTAGHFPLVIGGDCSILLGCLAAARQLGEVALVHIDGHSDFRNPANFDFDQIGAAAGGDLALAIGLGDPLLVDWGQAGPLVHPENVIQIGEREARDPDWDWKDIFKTAITRIEIFELLECGIPSAVAAARKVTGQLSFWVHVDLDILDQRHLPAVDSPGSPGLDYAELADLLRPLIEDSRCIGCNVTIYDPDLDPSGTFAGRLVQLLGDVF